MLSQFAREEEVLFPPCSMLVVIKPEEKGHDETAPEQALGTSGRANNASGEAVHFLAIRVRPFFV